MIKGFKHRGLKRFFEQGDARAIAAQHREKAGDILTALDAAQEIADIDVATFHLHALAGNRKGEWAVTVRANWRIIFTFERGNADNVNYEDYH